MTKTRELTKYVFDATLKAPRKFRFTLCTKLENFCLEAIAYIYKANAEKDVYQRILFQDKAKTNIAMVDYFANLSFELSCITAHQYEVISLYVSESLKLMIAWQNA